MASLQHTFLPSHESYLGWCFDSLKARDPSAGVIRAIAVRSLKCLAGFGCVAIDLTRWAAMTVTIYPMFRCGVLSHIVNLVSTISGAIMNFGVPFGFEPGVNRSRSFSWSGKANNQNQQIKANSQNQQISQQQEWIQDFRAFIQKWVVVHIPNPFERGLDPNHQDKDGFTIFMHFLAQNSKQLIPVLNEYHAANLPGKKVLDLERQDNYGFTVLDHLVTGLSYNSQIEQWRPNPIERRTELFWVLFRDGAILKENRFAEYREFLESVQLAHQNHSRYMQKNSPEFQRAHPEEKKKKAAELWKLLVFQEHLNSDNRYIRLVAKLLRSGEIDGQLMKSLSLLASNLLTLENIVLGQWAAARTQNIVPEWNLRQRALTESLQGTRFEAIARTTAKTGTLIGSTILEYALI